MHLRSSITCLWTHSIIVEHVIHLWHLLTYLLTHVLWNTCFSDCRPKCPKFCCLNFTKRTYHHHAALSFVYAAIPMWLLLPSKYTAWWQRQIGATNVTQVTAQRCVHGRRTLDCKSDTNTSTKWTCSKEAVMLAGSTVRYWPKGGDALQPVR